METDALWRGGEPDQPHQLRIREPRQFQQQNRPGVCDSGHYVPDPALGWDRLRAVALMGESGHNIRLGGSMRGLALLLSGIVMLPLAARAAAQDAPAKLNLVIVEGEGAINNIRQRTAREPIVQVED